MKPGILIALSLLLFSIPCSAQDLATLYQEVNQAIEKGIAFIRTKQKEDGGFTSGRSSQDPDGVAALCVYALRKSLVNADDPAIVKALEFIEEQPLKRTYSMAVRILALETMLREGDREAIHEAAWWLVENLNEQRMLWAYPNNPVDLSNTQYAILGLWAAERHGFKTPQQIWKEVPAAVMEYQRENGAFTYRKDTEPTGSMTTAGITILSVCLEKLPEKSAFASQVRHALERAWPYLEDRFHPSGYRVGDHTFIKTWYHYYLYGLERACAFADKRKLKDRDWYKECAAELVKTQGNDGGWGGVVETSFSLLFLRLTTFTTMNKQHGSETDGAGKSEHKKIQPAAQIPFVRKWLLLGAFDDPDEAALMEDFVGEAGADPLKGNVVQRRFKWGEHLGLSHGIDLKTYFSTSKRAMAYAFTRVEALRDTDALLWFGSDDGARIFFNGRLVHDHPFRAGENADSHAIPLEFSKGVHRLLVKVKNNGGEWRFFMRLSDMNGAPLRSLIPFTGEESPSIGEELAAAGFMFAPSELLERIPLDKKLKLTFDSKADLDRVYIAQNRWADLPFAWSKNPEKEKKKKFQPNPGGRGVICAHPASWNHPVRLYRKVKISSKKPGIVVRLSAASPASYRKNEKADFTARLGVYDGSDMKWFPKEVIASETKPSPKAWRELKVKLEGYAGKEILIVLECAIGGETKGWSTEHAFIDEFSVRGY